MRNERWKEDAVCLGADPDIFFPELGRTAHDARQVCAVCPVAEECLQYAVQNDIKYGVWGGLSERELQRYRHRRGR